MAIASMILEPGANEIEAALEPLHVKGCKITRGAGITLPPPSLRTALLLVAAKRASSRILQPIAAERLQRAWARQLDRRRAAAVAAASMAARRSEAATAIQAAWQQHAERAEEERQALARQALDELAKQTRAQIRIASTARGMAQRLDFRRRMAETVRPLVRLQATLRGWAARRQIKAALRAVRLIQSTWRRVRCQVLRRRLARAANALRQGGRLEKYRKRKGGKHERHQRYAWVSEDLQQLMWSPVSDRFDEDALKLRTIPMASITAVSEGVKTPLLKKMERRAAEPHRVLSFSRKPLQLHKPLALDVDCAFSIICRERVIDFYAESVSSRNAWLRDLKTALAYAHTYDHKAAMAAVEKLAAEPEKSSESDSEGEEWDA